jgi:nicotinate dehydrogenase subunit B
MNTSSAHLRAQTAHSRADFHQARGVLLVVRDPPPAPPPAKGQPAFVAGNPAEGVEILLAVWDDGSVTALHGHVDLGTGLRTALTQVVAEELDVPPHQVHLVMGSTAAAPNQGATIASASLQIHAQPLRLAAAQARQWLLMQAANAWGVEASALQIKDGLIQGSSIGEWVREQHVSLMLDPSTPVKSPADYRIVGSSLPRVDILAKATGEPIFVHDMRVPGMLHGRVVRPPYAGADSGDFVGNTLERVDAQSIAHIPGIRAVVTQRDFVGIVAEREEHAEQALRELVVHWKHWPGIQGLDNTEQALRNNPSTPRELVNEGSVDDALNNATQTLDRTYVWPYQMHASIGPSCAVADWISDVDIQSNNIQLRVWAGSQNPHVLRADLALLMGVADTAVDVVRMEAAGCYGRNGADDVAADAALLSKAVGAPVRVQLTREQEHAWEPKGAAQLMQVRGGLNADGTPAAYDFQTAYPSNGAPTLALLLTRTIDPIARAYEMGDRTARPPYAYDNLRVTVNDMPAILRASWLRGVSALPNSFAHESYIDELASAAQIDPVDYRLRILQDPRAHELVQATAERANWKPHQVAQQQAPEGDWLQGQGFAYARYIHSKWPGFGAAWAAWVADVEVHRHTGEVHVKRVVVGHDAGLMVNPQGVQHQVHGNVVQTTSRALKEQVQVDPHSGSVTSQEWGSYPILSFRDVPVIEVMHMPRQSEPSMGSGESSSVPGTAAIANAIYDATGIRFRNPPFTPEVVRAALNPLEHTTGKSPTPTTPPTPPADIVTPDATSSAQPGMSSLWRRRRKQVASLGFGLFTVTAALLGWRSSLPLVGQVDTSAFSASMVARGQQIAALGNCAGCHTAEDGARNAGGRAMHTPFGTVYTTNLTPDRENGIGAWSYRAFERAMREGVSRDGHQLYPAFPYTAFAQIRDEDMMALYAYLMSQPAIESKPPKTELSFPFNVRPLMGFWNAMFHTETRYTANPERSAEWNRGAELVNGLGHCGGCHTPRNWLGAELSQTAYMQGAMVDGWEAPALTSLNKAPMPWTEDDLFNYLRKGHSPHHGMAAGPMGEVVRELAAVSDADVRAMAVYLSSLNDLKASSNTSSNTSSTPSSNPSLTARNLVQTAAANAPAPNATQRQFEGSCGGCHHDGDGPKLLGLNQPLTLNTNLHSAHPDNLIRIILEGVQRPASRDIGFMPSFAQSLSDTQIAELVGWMRARYAPQQPAWQNLPEAVARVRGAN